MIPKSNSLINGLKNQRLIMNTSHLRLNLHGDLVSLLLQARSKVVCQMSSAVCTRHETHAATTEPASSTSFPTSSNEILINILRYAQDLPFVRLTLRVARCRAHSNHHPSTHRVSIWAVAPRNDFAASSPSRLQFSQYLDIPPASSAIIPTPALSN